MLKAIKKHWVKIKIQWYKCEYEHYKSISRCFGNDSDSELIEMLSETKIRLNDSIKELGTLA